LLKLPALAAMSSACSSEKVCAGLVSMASATKSAMFSRVSSSSVCCSSQARKETWSSSWARGCAQGAAGSTSAVRRSRTPISRVISDSVRSPAGKMSPVKRRTSPSRVM
jgi:hypothetical protein